MLWWYCLLSQNLEMSKWPSKAECKNKWYYSSIEYYTTVKMNDVQSHVSPQTILKNRMLSSRKTQENEYTMILFIQNLKSQNWKIYCKNNSILFTELLISGKTIEKSKRVLITTEDTSGWMKKVDATREVISKHCSLHIYSLSYIHTYYTFLCINISQ